MKFGFGMLMGVIILLADLYWIYLVYPGYAFFPLPIYLGAIILIADLVWMALEERGSK